MTGFIVTAIAMLIGVVPCGIVMCRGKVMEALVAYEVVSSIAVMVLVLLAQGFAVPPSSSCRCWRTPLTMIIPRSWSWPRSR